MKNLIWLLILGLVVVGLAQMAGGVLRWADFEAKLHDVALQVGDKNHDEIKRQVVAAGSKLHLQLILVPEGAKAWRSGELIII